METKRILDSLNKEQQSAVKETEGYIRVVAGAGSGKTRVLTHRYVYIAKALGVPTEHILSATFTNKAANVMKKRIRDFIPDEVGGYIGTFHSICRKILSFDIHKLNYPKNFKILDVEDQKELLREIYEKNGLKLKNNIFSNVLTRIEVYKSDLKYIPELTSTESVKTFSNLNIENKTSTDFIINEYLKEQRKNFYLDFADLMYFTLYLLKTDKEFNDKWSNHFEYIQVDEFQDVSAEQYELVSLLSKNNGNLFIVGDPDQTIYSFRGADVNFFLDFDKEFKDVKTIILDTNYRSTPQILSASNSLITKNAKRIDKQLKPVKSGGLSVEYHHAKTRKDECEYIAKEIADIVEKGGCLNDCAVLYRNNNNSRAIEEALIRNKLSYVIFSGFAFYKRKEIKDVIAYLQMAETADDVSFLRTVNIPARGIGKTRLAYLRKEAESYGTSLYTALYNNRFNSMFVGTGANGYIELVENIKELKEKYSVNDLLDYILKETGYEKMLMEDGDQERLDNVAELKDSIREYESEAKEKVLLSDYLGNVALITSVDRNDKADSVKMMTVHTAKGLEFKNVFVCQLNEGIFPSSQTNTLIYSRYSSDKQQESSIAVQIAECRKFCKVNNITVIKEYKDEARTGTDGNREEFQKMLQDAYSGEFDLVIVHRWDRFARNVELALSAQKHLDKLGIKVISTVENFDDTPEGDFFKLMSMGMAALYSKRLSREAFNGQIENAKNCKAHSGVALYGYEVAQKKYRIVPKEAEAIYKMFHLVDEGHTYKETVDILNAEGYRRRNGKPLSYNITDLLRNRQYIGEYIFNLYKRSPCREKWRRQRKPESEVVRIVGGMPQIVETEVFERVQAKLDSRMQKNGRGRKKGKYLLTGLITCGICGSAVAGGKTVSRNKAYFSYICGGKPKHIGRKSINIVYLDKYIINLLTQAFLLQRNSDKVIELLRRCITTLHDKQTEKLTTLKKQLAEKESLISSLDDIILKNKGKTLASVISNNITEEKNEADKISLTIDKLKAERNSLPRINKETLRKKTLDFKKVLDGIDFYLKQELLQTLIKEIKIHADTVETIINLHELAGLKIPLTCTVFESIDNIRHPFTLRNIEFDFNRLQIQL